MSGLRIALVQSWPSLLLFVGLCLLVQLAGGLLTATSVRDWYVGLTKPSWNPPGWIFGPVWTLLYLSMAAAGWLIWRERLVADVRLPMLIFIVQLLLNLLWSGFFFAMRSPLLGLIDIILLWFAILVMIIAFWRIQRVAALLLTPYLLWVSFAAALNFTLWRLNAQT